MKNKLIGVLAAAAALTAGCATKQPEPACVTGHGDYAVKYIVKSVEGPGDCSEFVPAGQVSGEALGIQRYPSWTEKSGTSHLATMAIRSAGAGIDANSYLYTLPETAFDDPFFDAWFDAAAPELDFSIDKTVAVGEFPESDTPDADNICAVAAPLVLTVSHPDKQYPVYDQNTWTNTETDPEEEPNFVLDEPAVLATRPAVTATYRFENTKFYVSARSPGVTFTSDLTYSETTAGGTCTAQIAAVGLYPAIGCSTDADCDPCADVAAGRTTGSGINPDLATTCDTNLGMCVLAGNELPGFKSDEQIAAESAECANRTIPGTQN